VTPHAVALVVLASWLAFAVLFAVRAPTAGAGTMRRDSRSTIGIVLQGFAFALAFSHVTISPNREGPFVTAAAPLAVASVAFVFWAIAALGSLWSFRARIKTGHRLVTTGPYVLVRHPIYLGFFGLLLAAALVFSDVPQTVVAAALYFTGAAVRIRFEETLLREEFGTDFDAYARSTPMMLPFSRFLKNPL
jgi:protein-S-isoprenylcysteine O-methyltransferase Ste14